MTPLRELVEAWIEESKADDNQPGKSSPRWSGSDMNQAGYLDRGFRQARDEVASILAESDELHNDNPPEPRSLREALTEIRDQDPVENALDPQWSARIARAALANPVEQEGEDA